MKFGVSMTCRIVVQGRCEVRLCDRAAHLTGPLLGSSSRFNAFTDCTRQLDGCTLRGTGSCCLSGIRSRDDADLAAGGGQVSVVGPSSCRWTQYDQLARVSVECPGAGLR